MDHSVIQGYMFVNNCKLFQRSTYTHTHTHTHTHRKKFITMSSSRYLQHAKQFHASLRRTRTIAHELKPINRKRIGRDRHFKSAH
jgi:hypothetical protein